MVVARHDQDTTVRRTAVRVAVFQCVAGTIDAGAFAIPKPEHAIDLAIRVRFDLL